MASENGAQDHRQPSPKTEYEGASRAWVEAKEQLLAAQQRLAEAQMDTSKAIDDEAGAWDRLQAVSGRGPKPVDVPASKPYRPYPPDMRG